MAGRPCESDGDSSCSLRGESELALLPSSPEFLLSCFGALDQKEVDIQKIADMYINDIHGLVIRLLIGRQHSLGKDRTKE